ncbi:hypothetical protein LTR85_005904 [Meristemomyces frigidus]|nr:hypothetical protein LTR85_005904 [Meristemomyces frigidus]
MALSDYHILIIVIIVLGIAILLSIIAILVAKHAPGTTSTTMSVIRAIFHIRRTPRAAAVGAVQPPAPAAQINPIGVQGAAIPLQNVQSAAPPQAQDQRPVQPLLSPADDLDRIERQNGGRGRALTRANTVTRANSPPERPAITTQPPTDPYISSLPTSSYGSVGRQQQQQPPASASGAARHGPMYAADGGETAVEAIEMDSMAPVAQPPRLMQTPDLWRDDEDERRGRGRDRASGGRLRSGDAV